jgi:hypothetical protein
MSKFDHQDGVGRRKVLECMSWRGTGVLWTIAGAVPRSLGIMGEAQAVARIRPCANNSASHIASLTSVLRPGTFFTCAAFANTNSNSPSSKMCHTGFQ